MNMKARIAVMSSAGQTPKMRMTTNIPTAIPVPDTVKLAGEKIAVSRDFDNVPMRRH
jgi:hypothetical protein